MFTVLYLKLGTLVSDLVNLIFLFKISSVLLLLTRYVYSCWSFFNILCSGSHYSRFHFAAVPLFIPICSLPLSHSFIALPAPF